MDPNDRGNWTSGVIGQGQLKGTKYGISAMSYPDEDISNLTLERARLLYQRDYWGPAGCDTVPASIKFDLFDMAVNSGIKPAIRSLQRAAGLTGLEVDGILGVHTQMAVQNTPEAQLFARFQAQRLQWLTAMNATTWATQGKGLVNRVAENLMRG